MARQSAQGDEAAAIAAAIARFEAELGGGAAEAPAPQNPWQRAALIEGVGARETIQGLREPGGDSRWLS